MATSFPWIRWIRCNATVVSRPAGLPRRAVRMRPLFGGSVRHQMERLIPTPITVTLVSRFESGRR